jgi:putative ABC transport system permease protein
MDRRRSFSDRLYASLLRAYPQAFRQEAGLDMAEMFRDLHREALKRHGTLGLGWLWARSFVDVIRNSAAERLAALSTPRMRPGPRRKGDGTMESLVRDLRYAWRALRQRPGFAAVTVATLALGLGANTAIFSVVKVVLLSPLPYPEPERLAFVRGRSEARADNSFGSLGLSWPDFVELRDGARSFAGLALVRGQSVNLTGADTPERVTGIFTTASLFSTVLETRAHRGRLFAAEETEVASSKPVAIITHGLWQRRFGSDPGLVGRSLTLNGAPFTVVGVLPPDFELNLVGGTWTAEVFLPMPYYPNRDGLTRDDRSLFSIGRLAPEVSRLQAESDLAVIASRLEKEYPRTNAGLGVGVIPLRDMVVDEVRPSLIALQGAVSLVLLIACANVANLLLARATDRRKEIALRSALGAGRGRIVRELLAEGVVLASLGGVLGVALGLWGVRGLVALAPGGLPRLDGDVRLDGAVLAFSLALSLLTGITIGLVPALLALRTDLSSVLKEGGRSAGSGRRRLREGLVVSEVALALVLLVGAGLLVESLRRMSAVEPGFRPERLLTLSFRLPPTKYPEGEPVAAFFRTAIARIRAVPGVEAAALVRAVPLTGNFAEGGYLVEGRPEPEPGKVPQTQINIVTPEYFRTMGIPLREGRDFTDHDDADAPRVVVVNETLARVAWPGESPLGRRLRPQGSDDWLSVIGVVGDVKHRRLSEPPQAQVYTAHYQDPKIFACVVARTAGPPLAVADGVRAAIWSVDKDQPVWSVVPMEQVLENALGRTRFLLWLFGAFAAVALLLAAIGIYGVLSYAVAQRTQEIGIRIALGARAAQVLRLVVGQGMALVLGAIVLGLAAAAVLSGLMRSLLFGVTPSDPWTFAAAAGVLALVALIACWLPARRATRVDPVAALSHE